MTSYRQLRVGEHLVGLVGLDELFDELRAAGRPATSEACPALLAGARRRNYIPQKAESLYAEALLQAYARYLAGQETQRKAGRTWRGIPREEIPWFPTLHAERCNGCGRCLAFCPNGVFVAEGERVAVADPLACEVGCSACTAACAPGAITFPPPEVLEEVLSRLRHPD